MPNLRLSVAVGDYDRTRPLIDGVIRIDGVDPVFLMLEPEEIFFRALRQAEFDICELSLSSFTLNTARGTTPYVGVPVFPSRAFRHTAFYVRTDRGINGLTDLKGRRIGLPEYQLTACVWARAIMANGGVQASEVSWLRGGVEDPGRPEKISINLPKDIDLQDAPPGRSLSQMLAEGEIDAIIAPRPPSCFEKRHPMVGWLFKDPIAAATDYFAETGIFPIMHLLGIRREVAEANPWVPASVLKAFTIAKGLAVARLEDNSATKVTLPFVEEQVARAQSLMGHDYWPYGMNENRIVLDTFLSLHHAQGVSPRRVQIEELFHPGTHESYKI
jgi:4,5-dihydroxyphthalate decarboxylase